MSQKGQVKRYCLSGLDQNGMMTPIVTLRHPWHYVDIPWRPLSPLDTPTTTQHTSCRPKIHLWQPLYNSLAVPGTLGHQGVFGSFDECLRIVWGVSERRVWVFEYVWWCLLVSVVYGIVFGCLERCLGVSMWYLGTCGLICDVFGCIWGLSPFGIESGWSQPIILAEHWKARLFSSDSLDTSNYQNLPMCPFQKSLSFAI